MLVSYGSTPPSAREIEILIKHNVTANGQSSGLADPKAQKAFEAGLLAKTAKQTGDIILYDNQIVLYKQEGDLMLYLLGGTQENEILLYNALLALRDSLHLLFR